MSTAALAVGIAVGSAKIFGVSMAFGAFLAGLTVGRSEFAARAAGDAVPMRDAVRSHLYDTSEDGPAGPP
jgi:CPA2 family monovalent cation:H+ antiporter-2